MHTWLAIQSSFNRSDYFYVHIMTETFQLVFSQVSSHLCLSVKGIPSVTIMGPSFRKPKGNRGRIRGICSSLRQRAERAFALTPLHPPVCVIHTRKLMAEGLTTRENILISNPTCAPWTLPMGHKKQYSSSLKGTSGLVRNCYLTMESQGQPLEGKDKIWSGLTVEIFLSTGLMLLLQQPWILCEGTSSLKISFKLLYFLLVIVFCNLCKLYHINIALCLFLPSLLL